MKKLRYKSYMMAAAGFAMAYSINAYAKTDDTIKIKCDYADFEFYSDGNVVDVIDKNQSGSLGNINLVGDVKISPKVFIISYVNQNRLNLGLGYQIRYYTYTISRDGSQSAYSEVIDVMGQRSDYGTSATRCAFVK